MLVCPVFHRHTVGVRKTTLASLVAAELDDVGVEPAVPASAERDNDGLEPECGFKIDAAAPQTPDPRNVDGKELWEESSCNVFRRLANNSSF